MLERHSRVSEQVSPRPLTSAGPRRHRGGSLRGLQPCPPAAQPPVTAPGGGCLFITKQKR